MDDLAISPEELAQVTGALTGASQETKKPKPSSSDLGLDMNDLAGTSFPAPPITGSPRDNSFEEKPSRSSDVTARPAQFAPLEPTNSGSSTTNLDLLLGVTLQITVELGRTKMNIEDILNLGPGSVVELDKLAGEPVDVLVNDKMIARGEVVVLDDRFGVRITDVLPPAQRLNSLK